MGRFPDSVCARGGYILASRKNDKVRVSPQCPICYLALRCAYGCFNICIFVNIKIKNKNKIRPSVPIWKKKLDDNQVI